ncbi:D-alanyl-D-alanine carboxypeptidase [Proteiniclasticum sp. BAD-10]|uniref:serine-type D-Ala-D-Ala carboxypeptidase n=1 Tax=Proteiniclasticum sediminis TaxID=2804028 RepID=A0A941CQB9_9CLOT|nr:D-alanyl-D-alanine carboxypeptidase family protein [Proteiniclasticum sediminis]MBR0576825.1 D-alanyl-D-alanine carboxypeptidase [Proteiniclasticum sediminis]
MIYKKMITGLLSLAVLLSSAQGLAVYATETIVETPSVETPAGEAAAVDLPLSIPNPPQVPSLLSEGVVVMDAQSGLILYEKNGFQQYMPASTTKMMTALLTMDHLKLDQMITIGPNPPFAEGASMGFKEGEIVSVQDLLYSLLLHSANDAALALAEAISGTKEEFAKLMNEKARELGCLNTNFANPSGLTDPNHKTTPYDLSLIARAVSENPTLVAIDHVYSYKLSTTNLEPELNRWATNKNALLTKGHKLYYEPTVVAKTGWTPEAGYSHTAVAEKDGKRFVVTVMRAANQTNYWEETRLLFEWAFATFSVQKVYAAGQVMKQIPLKKQQVLNLVAEKDFYYATANGAAASGFELHYDQEIDLKENVVKGEKVGEVSVMLGGQKVGRVNLLADQDVDVESEVLSEEANKPGGVWGARLKVLGKVLLGIVGAFALLILVVRTINLRRRKKRRMQKLYSNRNFPKNNR